MVNRDRDDSHDDVDDDNGRAILGNVFMEYLSDV
jgi:hypothetical protein